jgi:hypothetical protein
MSQVSVSLVSMPFKSRCLKALKNARGRDRAKIRREYFAASTKGGAKFFIHKAAVMTRENRMPAVRRARPSMLSLFRLPRTRQWVADPVWLYRRRQEGE